MPAMTTEQAMAATHAHWRRVPLSYGDDDCLMSLANHILQIYPGCDIGRDYRGCYADEAGALAFVAAAGGVEAILSGPMAREGFARADEPLRGDAIVAHLWGHDIGGLWLGDGRADFRMKHGAVEIPAKLFVLRAAWRL